MRRSSFAIVILLSSLLALSLLCSSVSASDNSAISGYAYNKTGHVIGSEDGALSDYQVKVIVHYGSGYDYGQDVYLDGHSLSWPDDIRFAGSGNQSCPYYIESYDADTALVWVKLDRIPAYPNTTAVHVYYGKAGDTGGSDGKATFMAFDDLTDDFHSGMLWLEDHNTATMGYPDVHRFDSGGYHIIQKSYSDRNAEIALSEPLSGPAWCSVTLQVVSEEGIRHPPWTRAGVNYSTNIWGYGYWGGVCTGYDVLPGHTYQIVWTKDSTRDNLLLYENGELISSADMKFVGEGPGFGIRTADDARGEWYFRDFYARAYTPNPPSKITWGDKTSIETGDEIGTVTPDLPTATPSHPAETPNPPGIAPYQSSSPGITLICCGGCICGGMIIFLLILFVIVIYDQWKNK